MEAAVEIDGGGEGALEGGDARGRGRQGLAGERDDFGGGFVGLVGAVAVQQRGERGRPAAGDFRGAEAFGHEFERGVAESGEAAFGVGKEAGEELVGEGVDAVGGGGLLADEGAAAAGDLAKMMIDGVGRGGFAGGPGAAREQGFGDAEEVEVVGAGEEVPAVFLGLAGVDADDQVAFFPEGGGEVGDVGCLVLAAEIDAVLCDLAAAGGGGDLFDEPGDAGGVVLDGEGGFEDVAVTVADQGDVLGLGVVEGDAQDLAGAARALEDGADLDVLAAIDRGGARGCFHGTAKMPLETASEHPPKQSGELKPYGLARLLRTAGKWYRSPQRNKIMRKCDLAGIPRPHSDVVWDNVSVVLGETMYGISDANIDFGILGFSIPLGN